ncbi:radical SAM protein [Kitasatospora sp. NPDC059646]|uniref:radical SAM protein n=1 Tax=Kitasatospora sp. NPDC059646 TaxID=3346893 RepID=UPI00369B0FAB
MTAIMERPQGAAFTAPASVELELTGKCQLSCTHCYNESGPDVPHGTMTLDDWKKVITECAELGVRLVQLIGGEPTAYPGWSDLVDHALALNLNVEVFTNLFHITEKGWAVLSKHGVRIGTSYYSVNAGEHDRVTNVPGSHAKTRANIAKALSLGIPLRAGIVRCHDGQLEQLAMQELQALGVQSITLDDARHVGRAGGGQPPTLDALCGNCTRGRLAILPDGRVAPCVIGRWLDSGNVKKPGGLAAVLGSTEWANVAASIPPKRTATAGCTPNDSNDCNPASTEACSPAYGTAPPPTTSLMECAPHDDSQQCPPTNSSCNPAHGL